MARSRRNIYISPPALARWLDASGLSVSDVLQQALLHTRNTLAAFDLERDLAAQALRVTDPVVRAILNPLLRDPGALRRAVETATLPLEQR